MCFTVRGNVMNFDEFKVSKEAEIRDLIHKEFLKLGLKSGEKIPSENELADQFNIKRIDIRAALVQMEKMGQLNSKQGVGRFMKDSLPAIELEIFDKKSFSEKMALQGIPYETRVIFADYADEITQKKYQVALNCSEDTKIFVIARVRVVYGLPSAIHISYIRTDLFPDISEKAQTIQSVFKYFKSKGHVNLKAEEMVLHTNFPTISEQAYLECNELVPLIMYDTETVDQDTGITLEKIKIKYRSDLFKHKISLNNE